MGRPLLVLTSCLVWLFISHELPVCECARTAGKEQKGDAPLEAAHWKPLTTPHNSSSATIGETTTNDEHEMEKRIDEMCEKKTISIKELKNGASQTVPERQGGALPLLFGDGKL
eukprot:Selendium_serpulae@DN5704_c0_g1_i1.p1